MPAQNLSFLKKKPTWLVFSDLGAGLLYLKQEVNNYIKYERRAYFSWKSFLTSLFICFLDSLFASLSSETTVLRSISVATKYLVGMRWL